MGAALLVGLLWLFSVGWAHAAEPNPAAEATCTRDDGTTCTIRDHHSLPTGTVLDYGDRDVVLAGELTLAAGPGPRHLTIRTKGDFLIPSRGRIGTENHTWRHRDGGDLSLEIGGALTLRGRLELDGHPSHGRGGRLTLKTGEALTVAPWGAILADGEAGGTLDLTIGGGLHLAGRLKAQGHPGHGRGGTIALLVAGPTTITSPARLRVDGARAGTISLRVHQALTLEGDLTATGHQGGTLTLDTKGPVTLGTHAILTVEGKGHHGTAGTITATFCGGAASLAGRLRAVGEGGADGGWISLQSRGALSLTGRLKAWGEGRKAKGGTIQVGAATSLRFGPHAHLNAEGHPDGTITMAAPDPLETGRAWIEPPYRRVPLAPICGLSPLQVARANHTATLLRDGTVLLAGGRNGNGPLDSLESFDPGTGNFAALGARLSAPRAGHSATLLPDGKLLLLGGTNGTSVLDTADLFDPATGTVAVLSSRLPAPRAGHTATLLLDGTVLIAGGSDGTQMLDTALLYEPASGTFSALAHPGGTRLSSSRAGHTATLLPDGRVLLAGGTSDGTSSLDTAELFDPSTQSSSAPGHPGGTRLSVSRTGHTATLLPDGTVLLLGGTSDGDTPLASGERFDPMTASFAPAPQGLLRARQEHTATLLGDGTLLVTGGFGSGPLPTAERLTLSLGDTTPPTVRAVLPPEQATEIPDDSRVAVRFSEPINPLTITANSFRLIDPSTNGPIDGVLTIGEGGLLAYFTPADPLSAGERYTVEVTESIQDTSGNLLVPFSSTFSVQAGGGQITLVPDFLSLVEGQSGGLTVQLSAPAPAGGLTVMLESAAPGIATLPASVSVPAGTTSALTSVTGVFEGTTNITASATGFASGQSAVTVRAPVPTISSFNPSSGKVGMTAVISGSGFRATPGANTVRFTGPNNAWVVATVTAASTTSLTVTVPTGAITGPLQVSTSGGGATSAGYFIVLPTQDFSLLVEPSTVTAIAGTSVNLEVSTITAGGYTGLTTLSTGSLPAGVTGTFTPPTLGPNTSGTLTLTTAASTPSGASIEVRGTAFLEGTATTRTASATLTVQPPGQTSLAGQVRDEDDKPLAGVTIKLGGATPTTLGTTDAAGNFLVNLSVAGSQVFLVDGSSANSPTGTYPTIPVTTTITPGAVNTLGFPVYLHAQPVTQPLPVAPAVATRVTFANLPDLQVTIPAGVQIIGWDGQVNTQIGVRAVPLDRLAVPPLPPGVQTDTVYMFSFGKVGGGTPTQPIPVSLPNTLGAYPGQPVELWYYNEAPDGSAPNAWQMFGYGTVSTDGKLIVSNPGVGIPRFCCGSIIPRRLPPPQNAPARETTPEPAPEKCPRCGGPIDLASGLVEVEATDFSIAGRRPLVLSRHYRTLDPTVGPFGVGWRHNYEFFVRAVSADLALLITPENLRPRFARQPDGSFLNTDYPRFRGSRLTRNPDTTWTLRFKGGSTWTFNSGGWLTAQRDRNGNQLTITRDSQNRTSRLTDPAGRSLTFSYGGSGLTVQQVTDPIGRAVLYTYDANDRLSLVTDPLGHVTRYSYDPEGRLETITDPRGIVTERNTYDTAGRVIQQVQADGGTFQISYQVTAGTITQVTEIDPNGNRFIYRFGPGGYLIESIDPQGQTTKSPRLPGNKLVANRTDALGRETRYTYDSNGNINSITDALGNVRTFTYDSTFNQVLTSTDPLGQVTSYGYDASGNLTSVTDPLGNSTSFAYNPFGQPVRVTDPLGNTSTFEYDSAGNLIATMDPLGNRTERTYDSLSRLLTVKDPKGAVTRFAYDALDRLVSVTDPLGGRTNFTYDPSGNLLTVTNARGNTTTHTYDAMNRLASRTDPLNRTESFTYDFNGNLKTLTDRKNQTTTHTYDTQNRRVRTDFADGTFTTYDYDPTGRLLAATDSQTGTIGNTYDALGRLTEQVTPQGAITYGYDPLSRRQTMQASGLTPVTYSFDAVSRLTAITQGPQSATLAYDAANRRTSLVLPNGISVEYQYDLSSRLVAQMYRNSAGMLGDLQYTYDANGNRVGTGGTWARSGIPAGVPSSSYDATNEQLIFGPVTQTFDANGNLLTRTDATGTTTYTWDARNRLQTINGPSLTATFAYDAFNRRISKTINGVTTTFHYDGFDIIRESGSATDAAYLRTLAIDEPLTRSDASGTFSYLTDTLGSTVAVSDADSTLTTQYTYEPFGTTQASGHPSPNAFQFTGRENDATGLHYYRARYYDPSRARFLQEDPIGFGGADPNFYAYVRNNPLSWVDPEGLVGASAALMSGGTTTAMSGGLGGAALAPGQAFTPAQARAMMEALGRLGTLFDPRPLARYLSEQVQSQIISPIDRSVEEILEEIRKRREEELVETVEVPEDPGRYCPPPGDDPGNFFRMCFGACKSIYANNPVKRLACYAFCIVAGASGP